MHLQVTSQHVHTGVMNPPRRSIDLTIRSGESHSPDVAVNVLAVKEDEVDHEHMDREVGEYVALVAVHQLQQLVPGLVWAGQVLQHCLACHPFNTYVSLLIKHLNINQVSDKYMQFMVKRVYIINIEVRPKVNKK